MQNRTITSKPSEKIPSHVPIYNMLYSDIVNGLYKNGDSLPSESALASKYGVSRNTLRLALAILTEDGFIWKHQGKDTIVTYKGNDVANNFNHIFNPITHCSKEEIDAIDISYNFGPPTEVAQRRLGIKAAEIVMACNSIYFVQEKPVGHTFIQIPVKHIHDINFDINIKDEVSNLINKTIFELAESAKMTIRLVYADENITNFLQIAHGEPVIYIEEILYTANREGLARCKFYFLPDNYEISINI
jgi:DNA-binding GntR family transcriptional regulator